MLISKQTDMEVVAEAADGEEAVEKTTALKPDLIIMDLSMPPGKNGLDATIEIKKAFPHIHVLILTMHDDEDLLFQVLKAGASGYILKNALDSDLISAIRHVANGEVFLYSLAEQKLVEDVLTRLKNEDAFSQEPTLSEREREILVLIAKGYSNKEIAELLYISVKTVESHKSNLMGKLGLRKRHELVSYAMKRGLLKLEYE